MLGFGSLGKGEIARRWGDDRFADGLDYDEPYLRDHSVASLEFVGSELGKYESLWDVIDCFVRLRPESLQYVWDWRLEVSLPLKLACVLKI